MLVPWDGAGARCCPPTPPPRTPPHPTLPSPPLHPPLIRSCIFTDGLQEAMLRFAGRYGPVSRFANPAALNAAAGWVFVNSPDDVQHICSTNTRNYSERCEG